MCEVQSAMGVGKVCRGLILKAHNEGKSITNEALAARVVELFKAQGVEVRTSASAIAWYKNDLRKQNLLPKGASSAKSIEIDFDEIAL